MLFWSLLLVGGFSLPSVVEPVVLLLAAARALRGPKETIEAFFILLFFLLGNTLFTSGAGKTLRYVVYFAGFAGVFFRRKAPNTPLRGYLWFFFLTLLAVNALFSQVAALSVLKLVSFFVGVFTIIEAFAQTRRLKPYWFRFVNTFFLFAVFGSLAFLLAGFGFERNGRGFQGIFIHPQTFGPVMAVVAAWFTGVWLVTRRPSLSLTALVGLCFVFLYMTQSRTAMGAALLGGALAYWLAVTAGRRIPNQQRLFRLGGLVVFGVFVLALLNPSRIQQTIVGFIQKREVQSTDVSAIFQESRGFLVDASLLNFAEHPLFGIGLGIPTNYRDVDVSSYRSIAGIPISASVEKGFLPSAILEEMGLLGATLTVILLFYLIGRVRRRHSFIALWLLLAALLVNVGEAVLFSVGGLGLFIWMIMGMSYNLDFFSPPRPARKRKPGKGRRLPAASRVG